MTRDRIQCADILTSNQTFILWSYVRDRARAIRRTATMRRYGGRRRWRWRRQLMLGATHRHSDIGRRQMVCTENKNRASWNERHEWNVIKTEEKRKMRIKTMRKCLNGVLNYCCVGLWFGDELMPYGWFPSSGMRTNYYYYYYFPPVFFFCLPFPSFNLIFCAHNFDAMLQDSALDVLARSHKN